MAGDEFWAFNIAWLREVSRVVRPNGGVESRFWCFHAGPLAYSSVSSLDSMSRTPGSSRCCCTGPGAAVGSPGLTFAAYRTTE